MTTDKHTILCVDDDPGIHKLLKEQLKANEYASHHAINGNQAIKILAEHHIDLIILDLNMPGMNGFTILTYVKGMAETEHIPVIFLSAHHGEDLKIKGFEYGADDFITKPFTGPILLAKIKAILRRSSKPTPQPDGIHGNVKDLSIFDLLQMLTFSDKCCTVLFPEMNGKLVIESGDVLFISQSSHTGNEAFLRLLLLNQGTFSVKDNTPEKIPNPERTPIDSLILSTAVQIDEIKEKIQNTTTASLLQLAEDAKEFPDISSLQGDFPLSPLQLSCKMSGTITANLDQIAKALTGKVLIASD